MHRSLICLVVAALATSGQAALAQEQAAPSAADTARRAILNAAASYAAAFNAADASALAAHWSATGEYVDPSGERLLGRDAIAARFQDLFADGARPPARLSVNVDAVRLLADTVAVEEGTAMVVRQDQTPETTTYLAIHVLGDEGWKLDTVRETTLPTAEASASTPLDELSWLVGEWVDADDSAVVRTVCAWTPNHKFLTRTFTVHMPHGVAMEGTQVIGWDPAAGEIRSWVFDSDGGFGQAHWRRETDRWLIHASATLPDGRTGSSINILRKLSGDAFSWESIAREVGGQVLPNVPPVTVKRVAAGDERAPANESTSRVTN